MAIDTKQFVRVFMMSLTLTGGVVGAIMTGGVAVAVPTAGVGGFVVEFEELQGQGFTQYATLENSSECAAYPSAVAEIDRGTINGMHLYKDVPVPEELPGDAETVRMSIRSDNVEFTGLTQKFTYLNANLTFENGQQITADAGGDQPAEKFSIESPGIRINDAHIEVQSQFMNSITLGNAHVSTTVNPEDHSDIESATCAAPKEA